MTPRREEKFSARCPAAARFALSANAHLLFLLAGVALFACGSSSAAAALVINEVCYDNAFLADETGNNDSDWIELYNTGPDSINLHNYAIGDANPFEVGKGVVLPNYTIPARGFLVVFASRDLPQYTIWTNAANIDLIPANATWKYFTASNGPLVTWKTNGFGDASWATGIVPIGYNDVTHNLDCATVLGYGGNDINRFPTAYFRKSFNVVNPSVITNLELRARINDGMVVYLNGREVLRANMPGGVVNHMTPASLSTGTTNWTTNVLAATRLLAGANLLAVEVHQASVSSRDLIMDLTLTARVQERVPIVHGQFALSNDGENVHLFDSSLTRIHQFLGPGYEIGENKSYGLTTNGIKNYTRVFDKPTPGSPNLAAARKAETLNAQTPNFSIPPGAYAGSQRVILNTPASGYRIFYTLDGSDPAYSSTFVTSGGSVLLNAALPASSGLSWIRTSPVEVVREVPNADWRAPIGSVSKAVVVRALAVSADNLYCSPERRGTYFIGAQFTNRSLPVVSLITDTNNLFGFASGLYVPGKYYANSPVGYGDNKWGKPYANYHQTGGDQEWERPVHFELFETNGATAAVSQLLGVTMHGGGTRALPQKALYFFARLGEYGADRVNYRLFPSETTNTYKRFLLRTSGNDWYGPDYTGIATMLKDAVFHRMVKGLEISVMSYRPTVAYLNGEYWGIHNLRESYDKHYLATHYGLEPDNCDILMHEDAPLPRPFEIKSVAGPTNSVGDYEALIAWLSANPVTSPENYAQLQSARITNYAGMVLTNCTGIDVTNYADYIIAETFFGNTDWPVNNCDFWRARTNQVAKCGKYGDRRWRWMLYDLDVAGTEDERAYFNMFSYVAEMFHTNDPAFLINQLWANSNFRDYFVNRYANLLNTTFRPERTARIISQAADAIAPEIETHFRRWGRDHTRAQWQQAVATLMQYTATRQEVSWNHLDWKFRLGGTGALTVRNNDPSGVGGYFVVNGVTIETATEGVTDRAAWTGTFFRSMPVSVQAIPDPGYVFAGWSDTATASPTRAVSVGDSPLTLVARFRLPTGYDRWQSVNYTQSEILSGMAAPNAPSGCASLSNLELYAFGMNRNDGLTGDQRRARLALSLQTRNGELWLSYTRLNDNFTDVSYKLTIASDLTSSLGWRDAVVGQDLDPVSMTNVIDQTTWSYEIRVPASSPARDVRFFRLKTTLQ